MAKSPLKLRKLKRSSPKPILKTCSFILERTHNYPYIAGVDEVGRGCLAGPVVVAGVIFPAHLRDVNPCEHLSLIRDSKLLPSEKREILHDWIRSNAIAVSVQSSGEAEIDALNILRATLRAAQRVIEELKRQSGLDLVLMDGNQKIPGIRERQIPVIGGDGISKTIAAASIVAKVTRDRWMVQLAKRYPGYDLEINKGYATAKHRAGIKTLGPCSIHRRSFLRKLLNLERGREGENRVAKHLETLAFTIIQMNWMGEDAEIDIIAEKDGAIHFFEVRSRTGIFPIDLSFPVTKQLLLKNAVAQCIRSFGRAVGETRIHLAAVDPAGIKFYWDVFAL